MMTNLEQIKTRISQYVDLELGQNWIQSGCLKNITQSENVVTLTIEIGYPAKSVIEAHKKAITDLIQALDSGLDVLFNLTTKVKPHKVQSGVRGVKGVKNIIAVASGKGGVGKSTVAVNLALALQLEGAKVGVLDADIYGPSQPQMLGSYDGPESKEKNSLEPVIRYGLQTMSIGYLLDVTQPIVWRGPMLGKALQQLMNDTRWQDLDYLIIDLPPGTGDIQLTLSQKIPVSGALIVTTPQDISLIDARRALEMFNKVNVPTLGLVENMSQHTCSNCGHQEAIFGEGGGEQMMQETGVPLVGKLPLDIRIRQEADSGKPTVIADPECDITKKYCEIARKVTANLSLKPKDFTRNMPGVVVEKA